MTEYTSHLAEHLLRSRNRTLFVLDGILLPLATATAFVVRFEGFAWPAGMSGILVAFMAVALPAKLAILVRTGMYGRLWRNAGVADLEKLILAGALFSAASLLIGALLLPLSGIVPSRVPLSILVLDTLLGLLAVTAPRLLVRVLHRRRRGRPSDGGRRVLIAGAGAAGGLIAREIGQNPQLGLTAVGFVDDDSSKQGRLIDDVRVLGPLDCIEGLAKEHGVDEIVIAMPSAPGSVVRAVLHAAGRASLPTRTVPGLFEILSGSKSVSALREVAIEDLLRRDPIQTDLGQVRRLAAGRTVLVTGAGGSIGSELCRQLARLDPGCIVALGRGENSIFELVQELARTMPALQVVPVIADVRDEDAIRRAFERHRPFSVFHAAAHKHVPLMERYPVEAVLNNILGTRNVARVAAETGVEHLVLISTDKAVRPTSIMGASKRIAESVVHDVASRTGRAYVSVRFGNVLGSRGSVVPTFLRQIADGGPVTVTHPEMRRYFMTIPEAVQLVLQAGALGEGRETFVLDMGEPVRIADLACDLIRLSGLEVGRDIDINFTGTRAGEKLYEELFFGNEEVTRTRHPKIMRARGVAPHRSQQLVGELIDRARAGASAEEIRARMRALVPDFATPVPAVAGSAEADEIDLLSTDDEGISRDDVTAGVA